MRLWARFGYSEGSTSNHDDRAAAIEVQVADDIQLVAENLLGVVVPAEYLRTPGVKQSLKQLTQFVEPYDHFPLGISGKRWRSYAVG
jgi:hypothetical protein